jgi:hypothetical protein
MRNHLRSLMLLVMMSFPGMPAFAADRVPFRASVETVPVPVGACGPACVTLSITGSGHALHMGGIEIAGPSEVDLVAGQQTGTSTLIAANGDTILISFAGTVEAGVSPTDPVAFQGTWEVMEGTGRFEHAIGSGRYSGTAAGPSGSLSLEGAITRVGSAH